MINCKNCKADCAEKGIDHEKQSCLGYLGNTNADKIRAMTDEELAKKISGIESFALTCGSGWPPEKWLDWLKKEAQ